VSRLQARGILQIPYDNPPSASDFRGTGQASAGYGDFMVDFGRNVQNGEESSEKVKAAELGQNNERRRVCDDGHVLDFVRGVALVV